MQVSHSIAEGITARILSGEWAVGSQLPSITQLAHNFSVGIGSIREALKALTALGVLRIEHGRGTFVVALPEMQADPYEHFDDVGTGSIFALCEAWRILEPELTALAAERGTDDQIHSIYQHVVAMKRLVRVGREFLEPDSSFTAGSSLRRIMLCLHG